MAGKIIKTGGNSQKLVFTMLAAILLLEFGSLTKLNKVWGLAFSVDASSQQSGNNGTQAIQVTPNTHPTVVSL